MSYRCHALVEESGENPSATLVKQFGIASSLAVDASGVYWVDGRMPCLCAPWQPSGVAGECTLERAESRVVRAPVLF